ncbi:hypothetical protein WJX74_009727 [Apatococcus lobatus]|uniref:E2F/DP family winged-helix DNA-binding domain-containing protein n=2 Tax=Apatococcus TaxID=904362 RepID=A0AAW1SZ36_9CHLO
MADGQKAAVLTGSSRSRRATRGANTRSPATPASATGNCRYDSSLGLLTKKFVQLVETAPEGVLDLNKAADSLQVQKRRIYDITNVLEGIGLIEKKSKNNIQWKGTSQVSGEEIQTERRALQEDVQQLQEDERSLDQCIRQLENCVQVMTDDPANRSRLYVTEEDIAELPIVSSETVFAVKAAQGTTLEVPDPDDGPDGANERRYRVILKSQDAPIDVWLVSRANEGETAGGASPSPLTAPAASPLPHDSFQLPATPADDSALAMNGFPTSLGSPMRPITASPLMVKLQNADSDPAFWFSEDMVSSSGLADIFKDDPATMS